MDTEARMTRMESSLERLVVLAERNFETLTALGTRLDNAEALLKLHTIALAALDDKMDQVTDAMGEMDKRLDRIERAIEPILVYFADKVGHG